MSSKLMSNGFRLIVLVFFNLLESINECVIVQTK